MKIKTRFYLGITAVFGVLAVAVSIITVILVDKSVVQLTTNRVQLNINSAHMIFDHRMESVLLIAQILADELGPTLAPLSEGSRFEQDRLMAIRKTHELDILNLLREDGSVGIRTNRPVSSPDAVPNYGDIIDDPLVRQAVQTRKPVRGTILLPQERLEREGGDLLRKCRENGGEPVGMFMGAAVPILSGDRLQGVLEAGIILNGATDKVDRICRMVFEDKSYDGKPVGTATIFMGDLRISTNVLDARKRRAIGTRASSEVVEQVIKKGISWTGPAQVVDATYLSRYDPIHDPSGEIIGMLYVGELEEPYKVLQRNAVLTYLLAIFGGMALGFIVFVQISRGILGPIRRLSYATERLAEGDLTHRVGITTKDEVGALSQAFDRMAWELEIGKTENEVKQRAIEKANEELRVMNKNYMELLGFVSHELKNPLASAIMGVHTVKDGYLGEVPETGKKMLASVARSLDYFKEIIKNYLDLSRLEKGEIKVHRSKVPVESAVIGPIVDGFERELQDRGMVLRRISPENVVIDGDRDLLRIVLDNLIGNAIKYGREGGTITVEVREEAGETLISVTNDGDGISADKIPLLFRKFSRIHDPRSLGKKGTGLGLYICKEIVEKHGGRIWAESEEGKWTRFTLALARSGK